MSKPNAAFLFQEENIKCCPSFHSHNESCEDIMEIGDLLLLFSLQNRQGQDLLWEHSEVEPRQSVYVNHTWFLWLLYTFTSLQKEKFVKNRNKELSRSWF